ELRFVLTCFLKLPALVLDFIEQSHILDGDYRLVGKGGEQADLLVSERPDGEPHQHNDADRIAFAQQRDAEDGAEPGVSNGVQLSRHMFRVGENIENVDRLAFKEGSSGDRASHWLNWPS